MKTGNLENIRPSLKLSINIQKFRLIFFWHRIKNVFRRRFLGDLRLGRRAKKKH
jgi:hypothetical protein